MFNKYFLFKKGNRLRLLLRWQHYTSCLHLQRHYGSCSSKHYSMMMRILTVDIHLYTLYTPAHTLYTCTQFIHLHTRYTPAHTLYTCTHVLHLHTLYIPYKSSPTVSSVISILTCLTCGVSLSRAVRYCVLATCLTANLGSSLQGGDEKAGGDTTDPFGIGKK